MCHLFWPFIDSYWVASMLLFDLVPFGSSSKKALVRRRLQGSILKIEILKLS
jgi:hypothetical protein